MRADSQDPHLSALANAVDLDDLRRQLDPLDFMAGWNKQEPSLWREPRTDSVSGSLKWGGR